MSEMIERVAEALMKARHPDAPLTYAEVVFAVQTGSDSSVLDGFRRDARAAIEAMREPTVAMLVGGNHCQPGSYSAEKIWAEMIDTALAETLSGNTPFPMKAKPEGGHLND
ncbi:hypothetical protein FHR70_003700 [Microvirga lupini]|uniref:Uncharacterized protein n=1 Tax=Microvirga lupini TaxID=420324 RepID=A0A7W4YYS1_9HYPH|nr:hypothetical protein [Microvirga lupini]MBB3020614.1 hypothetical protein [Microvirga lupini]